MRIVLLGPPGSGKGTQAELLVKRQKLTYIGTGDILRAAIRNKTPIGLQAEPLIRVGRLVPDSMVNDLVAELLQRRNRPVSFVMDGYPRTLAQAVAFDQLLELESLKLDAVINLAVDDNVVIQRISSRRCCENPQCGICYNLLAKPSKVPNICDSCGSALITRDDDKAETVRRRLIETHNNTEPLIEHYRKCGLLHEVWALDPIETVHTNIIRAVKGG
jgi:adenylate kinase